MDYLGCSMLLVMLLVPVICASPQICQPGYVAELDDSTFDAAISQCTHLLVDFYAPWCWHCKALAPHLDEVALRIQTQLPQLRLAKVDADKYRSINSRFKISEFPTVKLFIDGVVQADYNGPHHAEAMVDHLRKLLAPELSTLTSETEVEQFLEQAGSRFPVFMGFGLASSTLEKLAREYRTRAWFAVVSLENGSEDFLTRFGVSKLPALIVQHVSEQEQQTFPGLLEEGDAVAGFVKQNLLPAVTILSSDNLKLVKADGRPILLTIINTNHSTGLHQQMKPLAPSHPEFVFALLNASSWPALAESFHDSHLVIWLGKSHFYTSSEPQELDTQHIAEQVERLVHEFKENKAKKISTKQPPFKDRMLGFLGQNFMYVLLFVVTVVVLLQGMDWGEPRHHNNNEQRG